jgi:hypothetical protein
MVFNDNDDIFRKTDCDHIDRFRWNNNPKNLRWVTSQDNMKNRGCCVTKIDRLHNKTDIDYLEKWITYVEKTAKKMEYL